MAEVVILVEPEVRDQKRLTDLPPALRCMISALKQAVFDRPLEADPITSIQVLSVGAATKMADVALASSSAGTTVQQILCPFTLNLPAGLNFQHLPLFQTCRDVAGLRQRVAQSLDIPVGSGQSWLPVVVTAKGPLYAEVIGSSDEQVFEGTSLANLNFLDFYQPLHLADPERQTLYQMAYRVLDMLKVPPAVYLMQFGFRDDVFQFDRLWPFPAVPAIASLRVQTPDLFACHWLCMTKQPIQDLVITAMPFHEITFN